MKKFLCTIAREDTLIVELDETIINEEWMEEFRSRFYPFATLEEHARHISQVYARFEVDFIEGYGHVLVNGHKPYLMNMNEEYIPSGINIKTVMVDEVCEVVVESMS